MDNLEEFGLVDDADIALDEAALALALLDHDEIDIGPYEDGLSDMASRLDAVGAGISDALERAACLAQVLAGEFGLSGDAETYDDPDNADLIRVIDPLAWSADQLVDPVCSGRSTHRLGCRNPELARPCARHGRA